MRRATLKVVVGRGAVRSWQLPASFGRRAFTTAAASTEVKQKYDFINVEDKGEVRWVSLNRPDTHNAFNELVIGEITDAFRTIQRDAAQEKFRAVVLTGNGKSFSAGADLNWMKKMASYTQKENELDSHKLFDMFNSIYACPMPVIGRINGNAIGGGSGLVSACDFAFSVNKAVFGFTEVKLGLIPAVISPFVMMKIGKGNCSRYFLTGERFYATEATRLGLIQGSFETVEELDKAVDSVLTEIKANSPAAMRSCKQLINNVYHSLGSPKKGEGLSDVKEQLASEIARIRVSKEGQEGLSAFLEKRKPSWIVS